MDEKDKFLALETEVQRLKAENEALKNGEAPKTIDERLKKVEVELVEQEHRLFPVVTNYLWRKRKWEKNDKRRIASAKALIIRILFSPAVMAATGGVIALLSIAFVGYQSWLLHQQNHKFDDQNDLFLDQNFLVDSQNVKIDKQNLLVGKQNVLLDSQNVLAEYQNDLVQSQNLLLDFQNYLAKFQNDLTQKQNQLTTQQNDLTQKQNQLTTQQNQLIEAERRSSLIFLFNNLMDKIDEELKDTKNTKDSLSRQTIGRIVSLANSFRPYQFLVGKDSLSPLLSPERGQLLVALVNSRLDAASYDDIFYQAIFDHAYFEGLNLEQAYLSNISLAGAHLLRANLRGADLRRADLRGANLRGASLRRADLSGARLFTADLRGVDLSLANLNLADLSGADLSGAFVESKNFFQYMELDELEEKYKIVEHEKYENLYRIERKEKAGEE